jgi:hypothetical protein
MRYSPVELVVACSRHVDPQFRGRIEPKDAARQEG